MAMNKVQFQPGLSLRDFMERYGDEQSCLEAVARSKWPCGFRCRRCGSDRNRRFARQGQSIRQCSACGKQESVLANTVFAETKLPLRTWFMAMYFLVTTKNNVSALELKRHLGTCYRTAWRMKHKLMEAMATCEASRVLKGRIEMDDAYLGGELQGGKVGRGSENKQAFIVAVSTTPDGRPREVVFEPVRSFSKVAVQQFARKRLAPGCDVYTDCLSSFQALEEDHAHTQVRSNDPRKAAKADCMKWVNTVLGNVKRSLDGTYHAIKVTPYAGRYLREAMWRFNRRFDLPSMLTLLLADACRCKHWSESDLRAVSAVC
jgi:hypothetical protein